MMRVGRPVCSDGDMGLGPGPGLTGPCVTSHMQSLQQPHTVPDTSDDNTLSIEMQLY